MPRLDLIMELDLEQWKRLTEEMLIEAYIPKADQVDRDTALAIALERDLETARKLESDVIGG